ncbi:MAG: PAS domain S-box protein, partial [Flavobacteriales bacterium]|nr:PAS domain S-box protein [Flavobacteriales bacterium]
MKFSNKYQQLFYSSPDPIFIEALDGTIIDVNHAALIMHGITHKEMVGKNLIDFIPKNQHSGIKTNVENFIEKQIQIFESVSTDKSGNEIPIEITASVIEYDNEKAILVQVREIKKRKAIEKELRDSHKQLRNLSRHLQNIREIESTKIARDLHDILGQDLTALKFEIAFVKRKLDKIIGNEILKSELLEKSESMLTIVGSTLDTVRRITSDLRPTVLDDIGLLSGLEWLIIDFQKRTEIKTHPFSKIDDTEFSKALSTTIYRVIQEALTNVIRHANATEIKIYLSEDDSKIELRIVDN